MVTQTGGKSGRENRLRHMEEYSFFGERALLTREPRSANVIAETKVRHVDTTTSMLCACVLFISIYRTDRLANG